MNNAARKRKRTIIGNNGATAVELPNIPNVPIVLVPPFLEALQRSAKFFSKHTESNYTIVDWKKRSEDASNGHQGSSSNSTRFGNSSASTGSVHGDLMNRMESAAAGAGQDAATVSDAQERKQSMQKAVEQWMEEVKYFARRKSVPSQANPSNCHGANYHPSNNPQSETKERPSVPYALFLYLWGMQQEHDRVAVRRSALFLSSLLLQKSMDCRQHLELESNVADWVSSIVGERVLWKNKERAKNELPLLHQEAYATLSFLLHAGYGTLYPKICVAAKSLRHQCPQIEAEQVSTNTSMSELRRLRDLALRYGQEEVRRVDKLIRKADECLELLVPRLGLETEAANTNPSTDKSGNVTRSSPTEGGKDAANDHSSDEDSDIDWEEGDEPGAYFESGLTTSQGSHVSTVDRTMAAMQATGATLLLGGELEIDFDVPDEEVSDGITAVDNGENSVARKKLEKLVDKLTTRHLSRLTLWLDGLRNADGLKLQSASSSLVSLPSESLAPRLNLIHQLTVTKQEVSRVLSSSSRLNIDARKGDINDDITNTRPITVSLGGKQIERFHLQLLREKKRRTNRQSHSTRIQIKCKSR